MPAARAQARPKPSPKPQPKARPIAKSRPKPIANVAARRAAAKKKSAGGLSRSMLLRLMLEFRITEDAVMRFFPPGVAIPSTFAQLCAFLKNAMKPKKAPPPPPPKPKATPSKAKPKPPHKPPPKSSSDLPSSESSSEGGDAFVDAHWVEHLLRINGQGYHIHEVTPYETLAFVVRKGGGPFPDKAYECVVMRKEHCNLVVRLSYEPQFASACDDAGVFTPGATLKCGVHQLFKQLPSGAMATVPTP